MENPSDHSGPTPPSAGPGRRPKALSSASKRTAATSAPKRTGAASAPKRAAATSASKRTAATSAPKRTGAASAPNRKAAANSTTQPDVAPAIAAEAWRGRTRSRALYNRRLQRANERWPVATQSLALLFRHPDLVLGLLGRSAPVERDGRVLNRSTQALVELVNRFEGGAGRSTDATGESEAVVMRLRLKRAARAVMPIRTDVHVTGRVIPGPPGAPELGVRIYRQFGTGIGAGGRSRDVLPAIVFLHGGGWVTGDLDTHDATCRMLAAASRCLVVAVDYRLAPEHPFPAAVEDAVAAYCWVHRMSSELGVAEGQIGVMGDSAGGNLAAVVAQEARNGVRDSGTDVPPPVAQGLIYPVADARFDDSDSMGSLGEGFLLTRATMEYFRREYLPDRADWETAKASPLAGDLRGLAPALVVTAGFDPLRDLGTKYAEALRKAGVGVEYRCFDDQIHGFMVMGVLSDSLALATEVCEAMGRLMRRSAHA